MSNEVLFEVLFKGIIPLVPATDMEKAIYFYEQELGFTKGFEHGEPIDYVSLERDQIRSSLCMRMSPYAVEEWRGNVEHPWN